MNVIVCVFLFLVFSAQTLAVEDGKTLDKLKVQVYYESKCPDCVNFFTDRLVPSMHYLGRFQYTDLQLIPFGKAEFTTDPDTHKLKVECQHGEDECKDNAIHACILETVDYEKAFDVIACLMSDQTLTLNKCARVFKVDEGPVEACLENRTEAEILKKYGEETKKLALSFVPSVVLDDKFDEENQLYILSYFDSAFCNAYKTKYGKEIDGCESSESF